jgi:hypothetical protein
MKKYRKSKHTFYVQSLFSENCAVHEIMWQNTVDRGRPRRTIWRMRIACCITKATDTHSEYAILIAFPLQQWLHERASMLGYKYIACLVLQNTCQDSPWHIFCSDFITFRWAICMRYRTGMHKSCAPRRPGEWVFDSDAKYLWVLSMELV